MRALQITFASFLCSQGVAGAVFAQDADLYPAQPACAVQIGSQTVFAPLRAPCAPLKTKSGKYVVFRSEHRVFFALTGALEKDADGCAAEIAPVMFEPRENRFTFSTPRDVKVWGYACNIDSPSNMPDARQLYIPFFEYLGNTEAIVSRGQFELPKDISTALTPAN